MEKPDNPRKKSNAGGITVTGLKLYYRAMATKPERYWRENWHVNWRNKIKDPEMNLCSHGHQIFDAAVKNIHCREDICNTGW